MTPDLQKRVIEVHPEICFWAMNGCNEICPSKHNGPGYLERWQVLQDNFTLSEKEWKKIRDGIKRAQPDDVLDAMAAVWTEERWANNKKTVGRFPAEPETDAKGLRAEIVY